jgi:hypothetical protein
MPWPIRRRDGKRRDATVVAALTQFAVAGVLAAVVLALAGVAVLRALSAVALQVAVTLGVLATLAARHAGGRAGRVPAPVAGLASGALTTSTSTSGPPLLLYLLGRGLAPAEVRDTLTVTFLGLGAVGAVALLATRTPALPAALPVAVLLPAVAVGHVAGRRGFARLAAAGRYEVVLTGVLVIAVVVGLVSALVRAG